MKNDNKIKHHLSEDLLMRYSNGTLCEAFSLAVATHISMCDDCRAALGLNAIFLLLISSSRIFASAIVFPGE